MVVRYKNRKSNFLRVQFIHSCVNWLGTSRTGRFIQVDLSEQFCFCFFVDFVVFFADSVVQNRFLRMCTAYTNIDLNRVELVYIDHVSKFDNYFLAIINHLFNPSPYKRSFVNLWLRWRPSLAQSRWHVLIAKQQSPNVCHRRAFAIYTPMLFTHCR